MAEQLVGLKTRHADSLERLTVLDGELVSNKVSGYDIDNLADTKVL